MRHPRASFPATILIATLITIAAAFLLPGAAYAAKIRPDQGAFRAVENEASKVELSAPGPSDIHGVFITYRNRPCIGADFSDDNKRLGCQTAFRQPCPADSEWYFVDSIYSDGSPTKTDLQCLAEPKTGFTMADVRREFERIPVPESRISIQPYGGATYVNLETIFSTNAEEFTKNLNLLGTGIELRIYPSEYWWTPGNGDDAFSTTTPGQPWVKGLDTNEDYDEYLYYIYDQTSNGGTFPARVDTIWKAQFRVNGQVGWTDVTGTVTAEGKPFNLHVKELRSYLQLPTP